MDFETLGLEWRLKLRSKQLRVVLPRKKQGIEKPFCMTFHKKYFLFIFIYRCLFALYWQVM
jgi:hypothetical protein